jgi:hypothetical protein
VETREVAEMEKWVPTIKKGRRICTVHVRRRDRPPERSVNVTGEGSSCSPGPAT